MMRSAQTGLTFEGSSMAVGKSGAIYVAMSTNNWQVKLPNVPDGLVYTVLQSGANRSLGCEA